MRPRLTPYERHIRDLALVRMRAQRVRARWAITILGGAMAIVVTGLGAVALGQSMARGVATPKPVQVLVLDRRAMGRVGVRE